MPGEFLSAEQEAAYGRFAADLTDADLARFFFLDEADRDLVSRRRTDVQRLGYGLQLGTVRALGRFLEDPLEVPWAAVEYVAAQLGIEDPSCVKRYTGREKTAYEHQWEIRQARGYRCSKTPR